MSFLTRNEKRVEAFKFGLCVAIPFVAVAVFSQPAVHTYFIKKVCSMLLCDGGGGGGGGGGVWWGGGMFADPPPPGWGGVGG